MSVALNVLAKLTPTALVTRRRQAALLDRRLAPLCSNPEASDPRTPLTDLADHCPAPLRLLLHRAKVDIDRRNLLIAMAVPGLAALLGAAMGGFLGALLYAALVLLLAFGWVRFRAARNMAAFAAGLPFLLDSIQQLLRVGNSLSKAFAKSIESSGADIRAWLDPAVRRISHGVPVADSIAHVADRVDLPQLRMLVAAIRINARYGGSIAAVLGNLSKTLRQAARTQRELCAATAEARFSGLVLIAMPLIIVAVMFSSNADYLRFFIETDRGNRMAAAALLLQITGVLLMRRLMRLEH